jgi:para-aminobenzoate synthetase component 1
LKQQYYLQDLETFKTKALYWANQFGTACLLDSNGYTTDPYTAFDALLAAGVKYELTAHAGNAFEQLHQFLAHHPNNFCLGYFSYDLKNEVEQLQSANEDHLQFPDLYFFIPQYLIKIQSEQISIEAENPDIIWNAIHQVDLSDQTGVDFTGKLTKRFSYSAYQEVINELKKYIYSGDIYEINFCQEFFANQAQIHPINTFIELNKISPTPFANFFKNDNRYIISATPERFLSKRAGKLISQPIKGTARRSKDELEDNRSKHLLKNSPKELSENVMIVDLVRNDLTKSAQKGSVYVEELFGIHSFKQVHQMISTIVCHAADQLSNTSIIRNTFPMGSMTGTPKIKAMQLIEKYERTKRGVYSGAVGYFSPNGDFDFNVIIRTILYNAKNNYLSFQVGSAITLNADPKQEYEECMVKAEAIIQVLSS